MVVSGISAFIGSISSHPSKFIQALFFLGGQLFLIVWVIEVVHIVLIKGTQSLLAFFLLFILIDPLVPVALNVLSLFVLFGESGPVWFFGILFHKNNDNLEPGFVPLRFVVFDFFQELDFELVFFGMRLTLEIEDVVFEVDFFIDDVSETQCDEDLFLSLGPFDYWMKWHLI